MTLNVESSDSLVEVGLEVNDLGVAYGGVQALRGVNLSAPLGRITGLIGPNGAGKTTMFNACSGLISPSSGAVRLFGIDVTRRPPSARARMGLGRTFQRMELVNSMSVYNNVALGSECRISGFSPIRQLLASPSEQRRIDDATEEALAICGIGDLGAKAVGALSTGQRRLVELARVLAGGFRVVLLDEPSSGLDETETATFAGILTQLLRDRRVGVLLVEHDMTLVMAVCEHIFVLEFGNLIFEGSPAGVQASELVRAAYLGNEARV